MTEVPFDAAAAHRFFSADCFNRAWTLIEKTARSAAEDEEMIRLNQASIWHWTQRADCTARNLSVGYWQASRVHALLGHAGESRRYAELSLRHGKDEPPFYLAYAYEALARAEMIAGDKAGCLKHVAEARRLAEVVTDPEERKLLYDDLATIDT